MLNLLKKVVELIFSFILNLIKLFIWFPLFTLIVSLNFRLFLKGEKNGKSVQKNFN